ncbi:MAG TPA: hypothetical protein VN958_11250 [Chitinophagaceae bacterium]|nr:hypothetical protein [Chitinophagaceae bacterium]
MLTLGSETISISGADLKYAKFFCEPGYIAIMSLFLRRTLQLLSSAEQVQRIYNCASLCWSTSILITENFVYRNKKKKKRNFCTDFETDIVFLKSHFKMIQNLSAASFKQQHISTGIINEQIAAGDNEHMLLKG